jgi:undecaprenyl-diphosphatase
MYLFLFQVVFENFPILFKIILISAIEGITEFLPISSTAHILIVGHFVSFEVTMEFLVGIQAGAILAVSFLYFTHIKQMLAEFITLNFNIIPKLALVTIPTCIIGFILSQFGYLELFPKNIMNFSLIIGGFVMLFYYKTSGSVDKFEQITYKQAVIIGFFQTIALIPGVSRSASVIVGGLVCNLKRNAAVELSFISGVPIILIATAFQIFKSYNNGASVHNYTHLAIGFVFSFLFACLGIVILKRLVKMQIDFKFFGIYRIIMGFVLFFII